jgi:thiol-disulfide isomerase/thioredoxin
MKNLKSLLVLLFAVALLAVSASAQNSLQQLGGGSVDVQAQRGKVVVLAFGAKWLPLSAKQVDFTNLLAKKYAGKNVAIYYVCTDSLNEKSKNHATNEMLSTFASDNKLSVPVLRDPDGVLMKKLRVDQLPSFVVIDKTGAVSGDAFGGIDPKFDITVPISKRIDSLL